MKKETPVIEEIKEMLKPEPVKTPAERREAFLIAYKKLVDEHGCDFINPPPQVVIIRELQ
jgi:hypothetical protein